MLSTRWPFLDEHLRLHEELLRALAPALQQRPSQSAGVFPPVNLYDNGEAYLVRAELPGISKESLELTVHADELTLGGERKASAPEGVSYHRRECGGGRFRRTVTLPQRVDADAISATYQNGVLEVTLPRVPEAKPRTITVH